MLLWWLRSWWANCRGRCSAVPESLVAAVVGRDRGLRVRDGAQASAGRATSLDHLRRDGAAQQEELRAVVPVSGNAAGIASAHVGSPATAVTTVRMIRCRPGLWFDPCDNRPWCLSVDLS